MLLKYSASGPTHLTLINVFFSFQNNIVEYPYFDLMWRHKKEEGNVLSFRLPAFFNAEFQTIPIRINGKCFTDFYHFSDGPSSSIFFWWFILHAMRNCWNLSYDWWSYTTHGPIIRKSALIFIRFRFGYLGHILFLSEGFEKFWREHVFPLIIDC